MPPIGVLPMNSALQDDNGAYRFSRIGSNWSQMEISSQSWMRTCMPRGPQYTDEELLEEIRRLADELDQSPPKKRAMDEHGAYSSPTYHHRFGSWSNAVKEAGFEPRQHGDNYGERPTECPLCGSEQTGLDFHHWRYGENEVGCYLCRECHDDIHGGKAKTSNSNWLVHCVENLVAQHIAYHSTEPNAERIVERYNLPDITDLVEMAIENHQ